MDQPQLTAALQDIDRLAHDEYQQSLAEVARAGDENWRRDRLGRLVGVIMKEPFATPYKSDTPSRKTRAYRGWDLNMEAFEDETVLSSWQYQTLAKLRQDKHVLDSLGWQPSDVATLASNAQHESGFWLYVVVACREYLCNPQVRQQIDDQVEAANQAGYDVRDPKTLVGTGAGAIGTLLVENVPTLGLLGVPVMVLLTIIISNIGLNAFCGWAHSKELRDEADSPDATYADPPAPQGTE